MSFIRRKKVIVSCLIFATIFTVLHHWNYTKATWKNSVMMKLKQYQIELQQSIDFTHNFTVETVPEVVVHTKGIVRPTADKTYNNPTISTKVNMTSLFNKAKQCLRETRHQIAVYLNKKFESDFAVDSFTKTNIQPILKPNCKPGLDLIILLTTRPSAFYNRAGIRNSWGRLDSSINKYVFRNKKFTYKTIFTIGREENSKIEKLIENESDKFQDILRLNYQDTYENLTNKTMLTFEWVANNCQPKYVLKTDDDCFVNLVSFAPWFEKLNKNIDYIGKKNEYMPVIRDPWHRNYVPFNDFNEEYYKPYCSGGGYMLSGRVLKNITIKSRTMKQIINEDAYIGMVTNSLNIHPKDDERFLPFIFSKKSVNKRSMCDWKGKFLMHGVKPERQILMHWNSLAMTEYPFLCDSHPKLVVEDFE